MASYVGTAAGWLVVGGTVAGVYFYYTNNTKDKRKTLSRLEGKAVRARESSAASGSDAVGQSNAKPRKKKNLKPKETKTVEREQAQILKDQSPTVNDNEQNHADKEFAEQMKKRKAGTSLAPPKSNGSRAKTTKQSKARSDESLIDAEATKPTVSSSSSTTGGDADDDLSPALSPNLAATINGRAPSSRDVSDMLEAPEARPSVLKLTESAKSPIPQRTKPQKPMEQVETKKQRQNRKKREEKVIARKEDELQRKVLEEKQRRTAREARGEPAKNGMSSSKLPAVSAWETVKPSSGYTIVRSHSGQEKVADRGFLDTFDETTPSASTQILHGNGQLSWQQGLPSEEEQLRQLKEQSEEDGWATVSKVKKGKKTAIKINGDGSDAEGNGLDRTAITN